MIQIYMIYNKHIKEDFQIYTYLLYYFLSKETIYHEVLSIII